MLHRKRPALHYGVSYTFSSVRANCHMVCVGMLPPKPAINTDPRRRGFARAWVAAYLTR